MKVRSQRSQATNFHALATNHFLDVNAVIQRIPKRRYSTYTYMNCTQDIQANASKELNSYLQAQAKVRATEPVSPIAARLRANNQWRVRESIVDGEAYWQEKQSFKKLKDFKNWLTAQGFSWAIACKFIKLYETFAGFAIEQIGWVHPSILFTLTQPKYRPLLEQLRSLPTWTDCAVHDAIKTFNSAHQREKLKSQTDREQPQEPGTGWRQVPGGGRAYQLPLLHEDWLGTLIERIRQIRNQTLAQIITEMALLFVNQNKVKGITLKEIDIPRSAIALSSMPNGYNQSARGDKACANDAKFIVQHGSLTG